MNILKNFFIFLVELYVILDLLLHSESIALTMMFRVFF